MLLQANELAAAARRIKEKSGKVFARWLIERWCPIEKGGEKINGGRDAERGKQGSSLQA